jgi:hypothetical protein
MLLMDASGIPGAFIVGLGYQHSRISVPRVVGNEPVIQ